MNSERWQRVKQLLEDAIALDPAERPPFLDHACGGVCACTTCHLWIKNQEGISEAEDDEIDRMDMAADQQLNSRLGCQAVINIGFDLGLEFRL